MPYTIVQIDDTTNGGRLLAAPERWVVTPTKGVVHLYWPDTNLVNNVRELWEDDQSAPTEEWDKWECKIVQQNIESLAKVEFFFQNLQKHRKVKPSSTASTSNATVTNVTLGNPASPANQPNSGRMINSSCNKTSALKCELLGPSPKPVKMVSCNPLNQLGGNKRRNTLSIRNTDQDYDLYKELCNLQQILLTTSGPNNPDSTRNEPKADAMEMNQKLFGLLQELKVTMKGDQEETRAKLNEVSKQIQSNTCKSQKVMAKSAIPPATPNKPKVYRLTNLDDVKKFEHRLNDRIFQQKARKLVKRVVAREDGPGKCMKRMWDLMFDKAPIEKFSWAGTKSKIALRDYKNIVDLYKYGGTTDANHPVNDMQVRAFFLKSIKYATDLKNIQNCSEKKARQAKCGKIRKPASSWWSVQDVWLEEDVHEQDESGGVQEQSTEQYSTGEQEEYVEENQCVDELQNSVPEENDIVFCDSIEAFNQFEVDLNDPTCQAKTIQWIEKTFGHIENAEDRMTLLLERLIDENVLFNFCWMNVGSGKCSLVKYINFIRLFQYTSRTVLHQAVMIDHGCVEVFFKNLLDVYDNVEVQPSNCTASSMVDLSGGTVVDSCDLTACPSTVQVPNGTCPQTYDCDYPAMDNQ
ncbi:uncharacterized protein LOC121599305 [Anopheles merus]|uniref:DUF4806 domain-containing protein n=1 Tax=Anopheles merus TaxID=30066 RepID=A0A9I3MJG8_ANOME|nr:uncharacterized protein LOC121599305 [Anopheles merus]